uniref:Leucine-rich repeat-containing N-terminal plant-type domain-containing protein n=1 Tax=Salix viminalis TaxID=40686 RepID=A0A6N2L0X9_SALVM
MLVGRIPQQLVDLTFLAVLNLSYNQLEGSIPQGKQFNTFEDISYKGNLRLCGLPLKVKCNNGEGQQPPPSNFEKEDSMFEEGFGWKALPELEVIILRSNKLHGSLKGPTANDSFSKLKIFDLSNNSLSGPLPIGYFNNFKAMMSVDQEMDYMTARNLSICFSQ